MDDDGALSGLSEMQAGPRVGASEVEGRLISVLTWNLDGLNEFKTEYRTKIQCDTILKLLPWFVLLQEVVPATFALLKRRLAQLYHFDCDGPLGNYFTVTLVLKRSFADRSRINFDRNTFKGKARSEMGREMAITAISFPRRVEAVAAETSSNKQDDELYFVLVNTHLESGKEMAAVREAQLQSCLDFIAKSRYPGIVAGDLNLRQDEARRARKALEPFRVVDAAEHVAQLTGVKEENTWFFPGQEYIAGRYDRQFTNGSLGLTPVKIDMVGKGTVGSFAVGSDGCTYSRVSDHVGVLVHYRIEAEITSSAIEVETNVIGSTTANSSSSSSSSSSLSMSTVPSDSSSSTASFPAEEVSVTLPSTMSVVDLTEEDVPRKKRVRSDSPVNESHQNPDDEDLGVGGENDGNDCIVPCPPGCDVSIWRLMSLDEMLAVYDAVS
jgi:endonuclease/exonuclease/phosphatase family metal-dependent hydrolase